MKSLFIAGIIMFIVFVILFVTNFYTLNIERNGKIVMMRIEKLPASCMGAKVRYFVTYSYQDELYDEATRGDFCEKHHVGEFVEMKFLKGHKTIIGPHESTLMNEIAFLILAFLGILISILQWYKMKKQ